MLGDKSEVLDIDNPDLERFPDFQKAVPYEVILHPGDVLFIPGKGFSSVLLHLKKKLNCISWALINNSANIICRLVFFWVDCSQFTHSLLDIISDSNIAFSENVRAIYAKYLTVRT